MLSPSLAWYMDVPNAEKSDSAAPMILHMNGDRLREPLPCLELLVGPSPGNAHVTSYSSI